MLKNLDGINNSADPLIVNSVIFNLLNVGGNISSNPFSNMYTHQLFSHV